MKNKYQRLPVLDLMSNGNWLRSSGWPCCSLLQSSPRSLLCVTEGRKTGLETDLKLTEFA